MASDHTSGRLGRAAFVVTVFGLAACGSGAAPRFALRPPVLRDQDLDYVKVDCKKGTKPGDCMPEEYESSFAWDAADNSLFRPPSYALRLKSVGESRNVNAFDEVPDSSWFVNRIGATPMNPGQVESGYCVAGPTLDGEPPPEGWTIDHGKDNGANPGFRVNVKGTKYMLKTDESQGERATAATSIASRFYYAAGWWAPCDSVVYFTRQQLKLKPGLTIKANTGPPKKFDEALLDEILKKTAKRGERFRAAASRWLPGKPLGPFKYEGTRSDDPSDVIPHEHRRDLRGARVMAAWLNHFDSREQNSMDTWHDEDDKHPTGKGHVRHWYIDLGDCFGSEWSVDGFSRRHGQSYMLDFRWVFEDFVTLGIPRRPWDRAKYSTEGDIFGYFSARDFDPDEYKGEYPNPAFQNLGERDGAWAARIIARFEPEHVAAAVKAGDLTKPEHTKFLIDTLLARQKIILARYFSKVSPVTDVHVENDTLCAVDLARKTTTWPESSFSYKASVQRAGADRTSDEHPQVTASEGGKVCIPLPPKAPPGGPADDHPSRYVVVRLTNGVAKGPLVLHLYDLGATGGLRLAGIERPDDD